MRKATGTVALLLAALLAVWTVRALLAPGEASRRGALDRASDPARSGTGPRPSAPRIVPPTRRRIDTAIARGAAIGRVLEADGTPAAGAEVLAFADRDPARRVAAGATDPDGRFDLTPFVGRQVIAWRRGESCSSWAVPSAESEELTLTLRRGAVVTGHVRLEDGGAAPDVRVELQLAPGAAPRSWRTRTDARGDYVLGGIPEGWWVRPCVAYGARHGPASREHGPFTLQEPEILVREGQARIAGGDGDVFERDLVARYFPAATVTFELVFPDRTTVPPSILVQTWNADGSGHSSGPEIIDPGAPRFERTLDVGESHVVCVRAGGLAGETDVLAVESEDDAPTLEIQMRPEPRLVARLVNRDWTPAALEGVDVLVGTWHGDGGSGAEVATTDARGEADITWLVPFPSILDDAALDVVVVLEGQGVFSARLLGDAPNVRMPAPELAKLLRSGDDPVVLAIPLIEPRRLVVTAVDEFDKPAPDVALQAEVGGPLWPYSTTTDANGRATFDVVAEWIATPPWIRASAPWKGVLWIGPEPEQAALLRDGGETHIRVVRDPR